jgi:predicted transcriptional regulator
MKLPNMGELELAVWRHIAEDGATVTEEARHFAETRGLARTTILTVMERLRIKKYLTRKRVGKSWRYFLRKSRPEVLLELVRKFTAITLGGSIDPFMTFLVRDAKLTEAQLQELKQLVEKTEANGKSKG